MAAKILRGVIVGASTLLGKELSEELNNTQPVWDVGLADAAKFAALRSAKPVQ